MNTDGGPAFPSFEHYISRTHDSKGEVTVSAGQPHGGISVRDYFAGQALTGFLAAPADKNGMAVGQRAREFPEIAAEWAYSQADAMLAERAK